MWSAWFVLLVAGFGTSWLVQGRRRRALVWLTPLGGLLLLWFFRDAEPWERLVASTVGMLYAIKASVLATYSKLELKNLNLLAFLLWPGMDPERLIQRAKPGEGDARPIARGLLFIYFGVAFIGAASLFPLPPPLRLWIALIGLLFTIHFGFSEILSSGFRLAGKPVRPLFDQPLAAKSLNDFWTRRWNIAYVEMNRRLFVPALLRRFSYRGAVLGVFVISGLLHEMAISYPSGSGWGLPTLYFLLQGLLVLAESRWKIRSRLFVWLAIVVPMPLVFTGAFRAAFMGPLTDGLHAALTSHPLDWYFDKALWIMGAAHFLVLAASFQVPAKLNWREELPRLSSFNRKLMYAYGAFIVLTIVTFGVLTLTMHQELLLGSKPALFFAGFVTVFWLLRIALDAFYYRNEDWPKGAQFVIGHALLTSLFAFLTLSYGGLLIWKLAG